MEVVLASAVPSLSRLLLLLLLHGQEGLHEGDDLGEVRLPRRRQGGVAGTGSGTPCPPATICMCF